MRRAALASWGLRMDSAFFILLGLVIVAAAIASFKDPVLPLRGLAASGKLLRNVWVELGFGFLLAGLLEVLIPQPTLSRWLGQGSAGQGLLAGWAAGLLIPGGPYVVFPIAANLYRNGAAAGPLITLISAKMLVSPIRTLTYELPLLGWPLTLARLLPALVLPPLLGLLGHWLFGLFKSD
ncbi:MAG: permease [Candidatus Rokubacteria bacterium]|nr:permease [Candidatus Rokubacteria bacterium]